MYNNDIISSDKSGSVDSKSQLFKEDLDELFKTPFCIINKGNSLHIHKGKIEEHELIKDLPPLEGKGVNYVSVLPFCQIKEKGFEAHDNGEKILTLMVSESVSVDLEQFKGVVFEYDLELEDGISSNMTDEEYEQMVRNVIEDEIKNGEGSNFLMSRKFYGKIKNFKSEHLLSILRRLIENEIGSYWNFLFYTGEYFFIGASPERHLVITGTKTVMNPISGTLPKLGDDFRGRLEDFIADPKEINELFQVLDEELKIICKLCPEGGKVVGPYLKEMGTLIHTEYYLEGQGEVNVWNSLKESLFAATMVGSPLQNASRIVKKYEKHSRRYYSSVICSFGRDQEDQVFLDNAITIRTMEIKKSGEFVIQTGNSIVRDSTAELETKELKSKAQGLINAMLNKKKMGVELPSLVCDDDILNKLADRNKYLSRFWLDIHEKETIFKKNIKIDIIDNEDDFVYMIKHILNYLGYTTNVYKFFNYNFDPNVDIVLIGPGPGDPNNLKHDKMKILYDITQNLLDKNIKILGICLGHQILSKSLGYELSRASVPSQGVQKEIDLFGNIQYVGFYNSYFAMDNGNTDFEVSKSNEGKIFALKGKNCISFQFHVESVLTQNSLEILKSAVEYLHG